MRLCNGLALATSLFAGAACVTNDEPEIFEASQSLTLNERINRCLNDPRVIVAKLSVDSCVGADLFFRESFGGNGRSCGTCHRVDHNFVIDPAFISLLGANDPLFVAEFNPSLIQLEVPEMMRRFGLILENVDGFAPDPRTRFVLRSVPHNLSMGVSVTRAPDDLNAPVERTGWSGDGAPGNGALLQFQQGAITQHYTRSLSRVVGTDFRLATSGELGPIETFMRQLGRTNELTLANVRLTDSRAEAGRVRFINSGCNACHGNAGANASFATGGNRNFNTGVEAARHRDLARFALDGGLGGTANADGSFGNGTFNTPPLIEAADTGPFFHTATSVTGASAHNTAFATTIEEAVAFYDGDAFRNSPSGRAGPIDFTADEINNVARFLRGLNATFNIAMARKRLDAAVAVAGNFADVGASIERQLMRLASIDLRDAITVLNAVGLNPNQSALLSQAVNALTAGVNTSSTADRLAAQKRAAQLAGDAAAGIGTGMNYNIGDGVVAF
jgi:cytochrome c peroxidase